MTILGIGTDLVAIADFAEQLARPGSRLVQVFSAREQRRAKIRATEHGSGTAQHLAAVWALKESLIKCWSGALYGSSPAIASEEVEWKEIQVLHDHWGRPSISLSGTIARLVANTVGPVRLHATASHDGGMASAIVVMESTERH